MLRLVLSMLTIVALAFAPLSATAGDGKKKDQDGAAKVEEKVDGEKANAEEKAKAEKKPDGDKKAKVEKKPNAEKAAKAKKLKAAAGVVKSVDAAARSITITKQNKKQQTSEDVTFAIAEEATVVIGGEVKTLGDLVVGKRAKLMLSEDGQKVISVQVGGGAKKNKEKKPAA